MCITLYSSTILSFCAAPPQDPTEVPILVDRPAISLHRIYTAGADPRMSDPVDYEFKCSVPTVADTENVNYDIVWLVDGLTVSLETFDGGDINDSVESILNGTTLEQFSSIEEVCIYTFVYIYDMARCVI